MELIFDSICIDLPEGREQLKPVDFIKKPLHLRIQYIMEKKVSFWMAGKEVEMRNALNNYRKWSAMQGAVASTRI